MKKDESPRCPTFEQRDFFAFISFVRSFAMCRRV
jgi:hypothetical protein